MIRYKLAISQPATEPNCVLKIEENKMSAFPMSEENADYREYLQWIDAGNTPEPADEGTV